MPTKAGNFSCSRKILQFKICSSLKSVQRFLRQCGDMQRATYLYCVFTCNEATNTAWVDAARNASDSLHV